MSAQLRTIVDGNALSRALRDETATQIAELVEAGHPQPSIAIVQALQDAGARVRAYDPEGMTQAKGVLDNVVYCADAYDCATGADALAIVTEWDAFRALDLEEIKTRLKAPVIVDLRNIYRRDEVERHGFAYVGIGRASSSDPARFGAAAE